MNILIAGSSGLVGKQTIKQLNRHQLFCISRYSKDYPINIQQKDRLFMAFKTKSIDAIVHLATPSNWHHPQPQYYFKTNLLGTLNLLELAYKKRAKFIFLSSQMVYGKHIVKQGLKESDPLQPNDWYGVSKLAAEEYILSHARQYHLPITILRPVAIFGSQDTRNVIGKFIQAARQNQPLRLLGQGKSKLHFIHVTDVVCAIKKCLTLNRRLTTINLGSYQVPTIAQLAEYMSKKYDLSIQYHGKETYSRFYLNTTKMQKLLKLKPNLYQRIDQEIKP